MRLALADVVTAEGFRVLEARDGSVALDILRAGLRPSLILVDLTTPKMDGRAFGLEQSKDPALRQIATVVLTDTRVNPDRPGQQTERITRMAKPINYDDLAALLDRHCAEAA